MFYNIISVYLLVIVVVSVYWAARIKSLNGSDYARTILLLCLAVCSYLLGYVMELNSNTEAQILFWNKIEYLGIPFVSALWLSVGLIYTGHYARHKKLLFAAVYVIPFVTFLLRFTNDYHHLYFASVHFFSEHGKLFLVKAMGPWMYVQMLHSMLMIFVTLGLFIHDFFKNRKQEPGKILLILLSSFFAATGLVLSTIKPFGLHIDYMALGLPVACIMVILAILKYDFLETRSMARGKVFEVSRDAILLINQQNQIIDYNRSAKQLLEKTGLSISGGSFSFSFKHAPDLLESLSHANTAVVKLHIDQEDKYYEVSTKDIDNNGASHGWIKTIRDVTETYKLQENLQELAMKDELSRLNNRRAFMQIGKSLIEEAQKNSKPVHLLMMDLDHFKKVNDQYGHQTGDQVIQNFGKIMRNTFGANSLTARLGGEEFAVLLSGFQDREVSEQADTFLKNVALYAYSYLGQTFHTTVSIGIAKKGNPAQTLEDLMHIADKALYESKNNGRNCVTAFE